MIVAFANALRAPPRIRPRPRPVPEGNTDVSNEDVLAALEQELTALWRQWRVSARDAARQVHPRLDPTAYPMVSVLSQSGPMRVSELGAALSGLPSLAAAGRRAQTTRRRLGELGSARRR